MPMNRRPATLAGVLAALSWTVVTAHADAQPPPLPELPTPDAETPRPLPAPDPELPPAPDATPPPTPGGQDPATTMRSSFRGAGGFQAAWVDGVPITAARLRLGAGRQNDFVGYYATVSAFYGTTQNGLRTWDLRAGFSGDLLRLEIVRLGIDTEAGYLVIRRASIDSHLWALGLGVGVHASVDVFPFGPRADHAIFLEGRCDAYLHFGGAFMWGPTLLVGLRY
jgi:hypothetical protein